MDATICGTGYSKGDSLVFIPRNIDSSVSVFVLRETKDGKTNEVNVHLSALNTDQLDAFVRSGEDLLEACHERLERMLIEVDREEDEIARAEAVVENPPRDTDRYAH